ncbi:hypothetical protein K439DRAFT_1648370 [Ramaria rubella]|nr:hypothetical protein K439DRAFT_1648370 [Ramaria rubella]
MAKDPLNRCGPCFVKGIIARRTGIHLTRDYVEMEMHIQEPKGFTLHDPTAKKIHWVPLVVLGPNYEWSADGHDKLSSIRFPVWGIRDVLWVIPNNHIGIAIAYLYLLLVEELGGMPIQSTTDCGSETTVMYGFASTLHEAFSPELPITELLAHLFMPSICNTTIECGWLQLHLQWGDNVKWLWPKMIQLELNLLCDHFNNHYVNKDRNKHNPSGVAPNVAMALAHEYGGIHCLQSVDLGGDVPIRFTSVEYAAHVQTIFDSLNMEITLENVWAVYRAMLSILNTK